MIYNTNIKPYNNYLITNRLGSSQNPSTIQFSLEPAQKYKFKTLSQTTPQQYNHSQWQGSNQIDNNFNPKSVPKRYQPYFQNDNKNKIDLTTKKHQIQRTNVQVEQIGKQINMNKFKFVTNHVQDRSNYGFYTQQNFFQSELKFGDKLSQNNYREKQKILSTDRQKQLSYPQAPSSNIRVTIGSPYNSTIKQSNIISSQVQSNYQLLTTSRVHLEKNNVILQDTLQQLKISNESYKALQSLLQKNQKQKQILENKLKQKQIDLAKYKYLYENTLKKRQYYQNQLIDKNEKINKNISELQSIKKNIQNYSKYQLLCLQLQNKIQKYSQKLTNNQNIINKMKEEIVQYQNNQKQNKIKYQQLLKNYQKKQQHQQYLLTKINKISQIQNEKQQNIEINKKLNQEIQKLKIQLSKSYEIKDIKLKQQNKTTSNQQIALIKQLDSMKKRQQHHIHKIKKQQEKIQQLNIQLQQSIKDIEDRYKTKQKLLNDEIDNNMLFVKDIRNQHNLEIKNLTNKYSHNNQNLQLENRQLINSNRKLEMTIATIQRENAQKNTKIAQLNLKLQEYFVKKNNAEEEIKKINGLIFIQRSQLLSKIAQNQQILRNINHQKNQIIFQNTNYKKQIQQLKLIINNKFNNFNQQYHKKQKINNQRIDQLNKLDLANQKEIKQYRNNIIIKQQIINQLKQHLNKQILINQQLQNQIKKFQQINKIQKSKWQNLIIQIKKQDQQKNQNILKSNKVQEQKLLILIQLLKKQKNQQLNRNKNKYEIIINRLRIQSQQSKQNENQLLLLIQNLPKSYQKQIENSIKQLIQKNISINHLLNQNQLKIKHIEQSICILKSKIKNYQDKMKLKEFSHTRAVKDYQLLNKIFSQKVNNLIESEQNLLKLSQQNNKLKRQIQSKVYQSKVDTNNLIRDNQQLQTLLIEKTNVIYNQQNEINKLITNNLQLRNELENIMIDNKQKQKCIETLNKQNQQFKKIIQIIENNLKDKNNYQQQIINLKIKNLQLQSKLLQISQKNQSIPEKDKCIIKKLDQLILQLVNENILQEKQQIITKQIDEKISKIINIINKILSQSNSYQNCYIPISKLFEKQVQFKKLNESNQQQISHLYIKINTLTKQINNLKLEMEDKISALAQVNEQKTQIIKYFQNLKQKQQSKSNCGQKKFILRDKEKKRFRSGSKSASPKKYRQINLSHSRDVVIQKLGDNQPNKESGEYKDFLIKELTESLQQYKDIVRSLQQQIQSVGLQRQDQLDLIYSYYNQILDIFNVSWQLQSDQPPQQILIQSINCLTKKIQDLMQSITSLQNQLYKITQQNKIIKKQQQTVLKKCQFMISNAQNQNDELIQKCSTLYRKIEIAQRYITQLEKLLEDANQQIIIKNILTLNYKYINQNQQDIESFSNQILLPNTVLISQFSQELIVSQKKIIEGSAHRDMIIQSLPIPQSPANREYLRQHSTQKLSQQKSFNNCLEETVATLEQI